MQGRVSSHQHRLPSKRVSLSAGSLVLGAVQMRGSALGTVGLRADGPDVAQ